MARDSRGRFTRRARPARLGVGPGRIYSSGRRLFTTALPTGAESDGLRTGPTILLGAEPEKPAAKAKTAAAT